LNVNKRYSNGIIEFINTYSDKNMTCNDMKACINRYSDQKTNMICNDKMLDKVAKGTEKGNRFDHVTSRVIDDDSETLFYTKYFEMSSHVFG